MSEGVCMVCWLNGCANVGLCRLCRFISRLRGAICVALPRISRLGCFELGDGVVLVIWME